MKDRTYICRTMGLINTNKNLRMEKGFQDRLDRIRQEQYRLEDIYKKDSELYDWWKRYDEY